MWLRSSVAAAPVRVRCVLRPRLRRLARPRALRRGMPRRSRQGRRRVGRFRALLRPGPDRSRSFRRATARVSGRRRGATGSSPRPVGQRAPCPRRRCAPAGRTPRPALPPTRHPTRPGRVRRRLRRSSRARPRRSAGSAGSGWRCRSRSCPSSIFTIRKGCDTHAFSAHVALWATGPLGPSLATRAERRTGRRPSPGIPAASERDQKTRYPLGFTLGSRARDGVTPRRRLRGGAAWPRRRGWGRGRGRRTPMSR